MTSLETIIVATIPAVISFIASFILFRFNKEKFQRQTMAESTAKKLLSHKGYTDRSFKAISGHLGGWDEKPEDLRQILVRAGAIRIYRESHQGEKEEFWYLLSREKERVKKLRNKRENMSS